MPLRSHRTLTLMLGFTSTGQCSKHIQIALGLLSTMLWLQLTACILVIFRYLTWCDKKLTACVVFVADLRVRLHCCTSWCSGNAMRAAACSMVRSEGRREGKGCVITCR